jgi:carbonic anhydrase/acetyltransferase-like protein (isoleucine patch superfamily)
MGNLMKFDFGDGDGSVPAHRHSYGHGIVADTAYVETDCFVGRDARVCGYASVTEHSRVSDRAIVTDGSTVRGSSVIEDDAVIKMAAEVYGGSIVGGRFVVNGGKIFGGAIIRSNGVLECNDSVVTINGLYNDLNMTIVDNRLLVIGGYLFNAEDFELDSPYWVNTCVVKGLPVHVIEKMQQLVKLIIQK